MRKKISDFVIIYTQIANNYYLKNRFYFFFIFFFAKKCNLERFLMKVHTLVGGLKKQELRNKCRTTVQGYTIFLNCRLIILLFLSNT
jgi:hypothetical protein